MSFPLAGSAYRSKSYNSRRSNYNKAAKAPVVMQIPPMYKETYQWLAAYNGMFNFLLDLRSKLLKYGQLSDKQWGAIYKCMESEIQLNKPADPTQVLVETCNIPIVVSATSARHIAKVNKWPMNPRTLVVTQIKSQDRRGITVRVKVNWTGNVSECRCCGKSLTDWRSQATGVGPYCVKGTGIHYVRNQADVARFQNEIAQLAQQMGEVEVYIKKWHVQEGMGNLEAARSASTPVKLNTEVSEEHIMPFPHFDWNSTTRVLSIPSVKVPFYNFSMNAMPMTIGVRNIHTGNVAKFFMHTAVRTDGIILYTSINLDEPINLHIIR